MCFHYCTSEQAWDNATGQHMTPSSASLRAVDGSALYTAFEYSEWFIAADVIKSIF